LGGLGLLLVLLGLMRGSEKGFMDLMDWEFVLTRR
jgi:hypothetical protein